MPMSGRSLPLSPVKSSAEGGWFVIAASAGSAAEWCEPYRSELGRGHPSLPDGSSAEAALGGAIYRYDMRQDEHGLPTAFRYLA